MDAETARELFEYNPDTGIVTRRTRTSRRAKVGQTVGSLKPTGHLGTTYRGRAYLVHRIVWLMSTGDWPKHVIDHINGNPGDNRLVNLRDVPQRNNCENTKRANSNTTTGLLGVSRLNGKFHASIGVARKKIHLGDHLTAEAAHNAYLVAKRELHAGCTI